jgi:nitrogen fixation/metabolism regulation signal transduction histidine kinase
MISRKLYIKIMLYILLIVLFSLLLGYLVFSGRNLRFSLVCFAMIIILAYSMISYLNRTNRNISYFFNAVKNDDSSLTFPLDGNTGSLKDLADGMNKVNRQIQQLKIRNRQQEQYFQKILEHLATGIITYDSKGFIHHANTAAKKLFYADVLTHLRQLEKIDENLPVVIKNIKPYERRLVKVSTHHGETQLSLKSTSFGSQENELTILSVQDIRHELDEKEVESWMKLIRVLMHEIMNSITPITSLSESLSRIYNPENRPLSPPEVSEKTIATTIRGLDVIKEQGHGLMSFVESYRTLTRIPEPEKKLFKVCNLLSRVEILSDLLLNGRRMKIDFQCTDPDLEISADENLISQVLINLIKNAIEANEENDKAQIKITARLNELCPEICVSDNGPGISEKNLKEIFVPFFTTRENGSGIGLSISKQIMRAHKGHLNVRSTPGKETIFCMTFSD